MVDRNDTDERQARINAMIETFRLAEQRRLVKLGIALWNRAEAARAARVWGVSPPRPKVH